MDRIDLFLLDEYWRPQHHLPLSDWPETVAQLLAQDARWIALHQLRTPTAGPAPRLADIALTRMLRRQLQPLGLRLADHVIRAGDERFSFRRSGLL